MKRLHVHVSVEDIPHSIAFYSALFAAKPSVVKTDYAKWMLDDPRVNFAISTRGREPGLDHLGIQVERRSFTKSTAACAKREGTLSNRARRLAATPSPRSRGSMTPQASLGKPSTPQAKALCTVTAPVKIRRASPKRSNRRAALRRQRQVLPHAARRDDALWLIAPIMCCSSAPDIRRARS